MTLDEAMGKLKVVLGFRNDLAVNGPQQLKLAQEHFERGPEYPWFLLSEDSFVLTSPGDRRLRVPDGYIAEYEEGALYFDRQDGSDLIQLYKYDNDFLMRKAGSAATGKPQYYSADGQYFNIFPVPDDIYRIQMKFYKHDAAVTGLSGTGTNLWLTNAPDCLIGQAGGILASGYRDNVAQAKFSAIESEGRSLLHSQNETMKNDNRVYQIGGEQ